MTDEQIEQATAWLKALAEAKCGNTECFNGIVCAERIEESCKTCNGTSLDPRTEMFRATCPGIDEEDVGVRYHDNCCDNKKYRPLTIAEAEAKGLEMLERFQWINLNWYGTWSVYAPHMTKTTGVVHGDTPLLAILAAIGSAVGLEVTV